MAVIIHLQNLCLVSIGICETAQFLCQFGLFKMVNESFC